MVQAGQYIDGGRAAYKHIDGAPDQYIDGGAARDHRFRRSWSDSGINTRKIYRLMDIDADSVINSK